MIARTSLPVLANGLRTRLGLRTSQSWQPSDETLRRWEDLRAVPASPLRSVVAVGESTDASGITVELLALELRAHGAILHWRARSNREGLLLSAAVSVVDQLGTPYRIIGGGGGGNAEAWQGETFVLPPPPAGAHLSITLQAFGPPTDRPLPDRVPKESIAGPWRFVVIVPNG